MESGRSQARPAVCGGVRADREVDRLGLAFAGAGGGRARNHFLHAENSRRVETAPSASEPPLPEKVATVEELYLTGLHLEQYRHATCGPENYWREGLRCDPGDARCNNALGRWHLRRGEFALARSCFQSAIARLTQRNFNPADGEPLYNLGLCLVYEMDAGANVFEEAYASFYKATWNQAWQAAAYHALAELDCRKEHWATALDHLDRSLRMNTDNLRARNLKVIVLRKLGCDRRKPDGAAVADAGAWIGSIGGRAIFAEKR